MFVCAFVCVTERENCVCVCQHFWEHWYVCVVCVYFHKWYVTLCVPEIRMCGPTAVCIAKKKRKKKYLAWEGFEQEAFG
jgi:hypothetical protein